MWIIFLGVLGYLVVVGVTAAILENTVVEDRLVGLELGVFWPVTVPVVVILAFISGVEKFTNYIIQKK